MTQVCILWYIIVHISTTTGILLVGRLGAEEVEMLPSPIAMNIDVDIP